MLASGSFDDIFLKGTILLWDPTTGQCLRTLRDDKLWPNKIAFSEDGEILASSSTASPHNMALGSNHWTVPAQTSGLYL